MAMAPSKQKRDLSQQQFIEVAKREGFQPQGFLGYFDLGIKDHKISVSVLNAGTRRRDQLAYLRSQRRKHNARLFGGVS